MNPKTLIWIGAFIGGAVGGYLPVIFGGSTFSVISIILSTLGGIVGIWLGFKLSKML